jgi:hypothetical protein
MAASPHLSRKIRDTFGTEAGDELIGILDRLSNDVSELRGDFAELRHQMTVGFERMDKRIEIGLREQTRFFFLAWATMLAAIVGLYAR